MLAGIGTRTVHVLCQGLGLAGDGCGRAPFLRREHVERNQRAGPPLARRRARRSRFALERSQTTRHLDHFLARDDQPPGFVPGAVIAGVPATDAPNATATTSTSFVE